MRIVIAPDSFKETATAMEVATAIEAGLKPELPDATIIKCPMADGGEGTVQSLVDATGGRLVKVHVTGPVGQQVEATYGILGDHQTAVIEMAEASGIHLVDRDLKDPKITTSFGTGELIRHALDAGVEKFIVGIGGSATNDAGAGMLQALGVHFYDEAGLELRPGGAALSQLARIDATGLDSRLKDVKIRVACDVDNPLLGETGASAIYGPQKGATSEDILLLDRALQNFADLVEPDCGHDIRSAKGAGAAGGLGAAFLAYLPATLERGATIVSDVVGLKQHISHADLVITGEGGVNHQTIYGKTPIHVAKVAKSFDLPVIALCGSVSNGYETVFEGGIDAVFSTLTELTDLDTLAKTTPQHIQKTARNVARLLKIRLNL